MSGESRADAVYRVAPRVTPATTGLARSVHDRLVVHAKAASLDPTLVLTRLMGNLLYKVSPRDPVAFGLAFVVITIAALTACFLPAWRATRIDPVQALREQ